MGVEMNYLCRRWILWYAGWPLIGRNNIPEKKMVMWYEDVALAMQFAVTHLDA